MKGCFTTLFLALIAALIAGFFGKSCHRDRVEDLLTQRVAGIEESFPSVDVSYDHLTAKVSGTATREELEIIRTRFDELRLGNGRVHYDIEIVAPPPPPPTKPSIFRIHRDNDKLTLRGTVDSEQTKAILGKTAAIEGVTVDNQLEVSSDVILFPSVGSAVAAIPPLISSAKNASLEADPRRVVIRGLLADNSQKQKILGYFASEKWNGATIVDQLTVPPPKILPTFSWKQEDSKKVVLTGMVPSIEIRDSIEKAARDLVGPNGTVVNRMEVGENVKSAKWLVAFPEFAAKTLPKIKNPDISFGPNGANFAGSVSSDRLKNDISKAFVGIDPPTNFDMNLKVVIPPPPKVPPTLVWQQEGKKKITLTGLVPMAAIRDSIAKSAQGLVGPDGTVVNKIRVAKNVTTAPWLTSFPPFADENASRNRKSSDQFWPERLELLGTGSQQRNRESYFAGV